MTATIEETTDLTELDFEHTPMCEVYWTRTIWGLIHPNRMETAPAEWLITFHAKEPCGHSPFAPSVFMCGPCWSVWSSIPLECGFCHRVYTNLRDVIASWQPIGKGRG